VAVKVFAAVLTSLLLYSACAYCGDEDRAPAYLIYIDPETQKYTTDDPGVATRPETAATAQTSPENNSALLAAVSVLAILVAIVVLKRRRKSIA
jgi:LPXTG-motif cell wall-anchored protein